MRLFKEPSLKTSQTPIETKMQITSGNKVPDRNMAQKTPFSQSFTKKSLTTRIEQSDDAESEVHSPCLTERTEREHRILSDLIRQLKNFQNLQTCKNQLRTKIPLEEVMKLLREGKIDNYLKEKDFLDSIFNMIRSIIFRVADYKSIISLI